MFVAKEIDLPMCFQTRRDVAADDLGGMPGAANENEEWQWLTIDEAATEVVTTLLLRPDDGRP